MGRLKKIWSDPVWSKVISTGVLAFISGILYLFTVWWPTVGQWFFLERKTPNWLLALLCLLLLFSIFICFIFKFRYDREKINTNTVALDQSVYKKIKKILPWDGSISFIRDHDFYSGFNNDRLTDLYNFCDEFRDPNFYFIDPILKKMCNSLLDEINQFLSLIGKKLHQEVTLIFLRFHGNGKEIDQKNFRR